MKRSRTEFRVDKYEVVQEKVIWILPEYQEGITVEGLSKKVSEELEPSFFSRPEVEEYVMAVVFALKAEGVIEDVPDQVSEAVRLIARGRGALMSSVSRGQTTVVRRLLAEGVDSESKNAALISAVINNQAEAVKLLLEAGADANVREELFGRMPLIYASLKHASQEVVALLKEAGATE